MSDAKYFQRGKIQELRSELNSDKRDPKFLKKKTTLKKIVANMTMGNDMSGLFQDVIGCMNLNILEIKKMVYLYLINYSRSKPELAAQAAHYFLRDASDPNPLIRALALRTMGYIHVDKITESLVEPLRQGLQDQDPYVRKTAAVCVAKLYIHNRQLVNDEGFIPMLKDLLLDPNPAVVANAVSSLAEISERSPDLTLQLNMRIASKLIAALNECSEWGQAYVLDTLLYVVPQEPGDAEMLAERIAPRLQHANSSVVLNAIKLIIYLMNYMSNEQDVKNFTKKLSPPLVTLLSSGPEVQYVVLRNILLIIQKHPTVLQGEIKVFFCKYNDPIYVKLAKLEIIFRLTTADNVNQVLSELVEYASEVDVDFVRKSVRAIGRLAIKIPSATQKCISSLLDLIQTKVNYVVQEGIVVIKDIFRKYPNKYESIIGKLCENLDTLDEPEAKAAMIWILGQYADRIENSDEILDGFLENFLEEAPEVQLSLLTAVVKLFIKRPTAGQNLVPKVLKWSTDEVDNPDLRDRGFIYWRLLSVDPAAAKAIVLSEKPEISTETENIEKTLLDELLFHISTLSSVYHKVPGSFIPNAKPRYLIQSKVLYCLVYKGDDKTKEPIDNAPRQVPAPPPAEEQKQTAFPQTFENTFSNDVNLDNDFFNNDYVNTAAPVRNNHMVDLLEFDDGNFDSPMGQISSTVDYGNSEMAQSNISYESNLLGQSGYNSVSSVTGANMITGSTNMPIYDPYKSSQFPGYATSKSIFGLNDEAGNNQSLIHGSNPSLAPNNTNSPFSSHSQSNYNSFSEFNSSTNTSSFYTPNASQTMNTSSTSNFDLLSDFSSNTMGGSSSNFNSVASRSNSTPFDNSTNLMGDDRLNSAPTRSMSTPFDQHSSLIDDFGLGNNSTSYSKNGHEQSSNSFFTANNTNSSDLLADNMRQLSLETAYVAPKTKLLDASTSQGLEIYGTFSRKRGQIQMELRLVNRNQVPLSDFALQFNKNPFGITMKDPLYVPSPLQPMQSHDAVVNLSRDGPTGPCTPSNLVQLAFKSNMGVFYTQTTVSLHVLFNEDGCLDQTDFLSQWHQWADMEERRFDIYGIQTIPTIKALRDKLHLNNVFTVADRQIDGKNYLFISLQLDDSTLFLVELTCPTPVTSCSLSIKPSHHPNLLLVKEALENILKS